MSTLKEEKLGSRNTVLLIHSDTEFLNSLSASLKSLGFGIIIAQDGEMAKTLFSIYQDQITVVILDVILTKKDGFIILQEIKNINKYIPVVMVTNLNDVEDIKKAKELGAEDYMIRSKVTPQEIANKIYMILKVKNHSYNKLNI
ncbi:MAG: response regulator [Patescibacteria group bacterium]